MCREELGHRVQHRELSVSFRFPFDLKGSVGNKGRSDLDLASPCLSLVSKNKTPELRGRPFVNRSQT